MFAVRLMEMYTFSFIYFVRTYQCVIQQETGILFDEHIFSESKDSKFLVRLSGGGGGQHERLVLKLH